MNASQEEENEIAFKERDDEKKSLEKPYYEHRHEATVSLIHFQCRSRRRYSTHALHVQQERACMASL